MYAASLFAAFTAALFALLFAILPGAQAGGDFFVDLKLFSRRKSGRHPAPLDPPLAAILHLVADGQSFEVEAPDLLHAHIVGWIAEAGSHAEAQQIKPKRFVLNGEGTIVCFG